MENFQLPKKKKGFACLSPEERKRIASMGGKKAHELGVAHQWDSKSAAEAGRKGGTSSKVLNKLTNGNFTEEVYE